MCFSPKVKVPKAQITNTPIEPAPLADQVDGVQFGDGSASNDVTGTKALTNDLEKSSDTTADLSNTNTSSSDIKVNTASNTGKSIKRKSVFGGNQ